MFCCAVATAKSTIPCGFAPFLSCTLCPLFLSERHPLSLLLGIEDDDLEDRRRSAAAVGLWSVACMEFHPIGFVRHDCVVGALQIHHQLGLWSSVSHPDGVLR